MVDLCHTGEYYSTATGIMPMLYSIRDCIPMAFTILLTSIFFVFFAGNYFFIKGKTGRAKILVAFMSSSFLTTVLAMFLTLGSLITYKGLLFWVFITILCFILLIVSDKQ